MNLVRQERERRGLTQEELAKESGVRQSHISRIESGARCMTDTGQRIARALGTTVEKLFPLDEAA